jgi:hypothetical protein
LSHFAIFSWLVIPVCVGGAALGLIYIEMLPTDAANFFKVVSLWGVLFGKFLLKFLLPYLKRCLFLTDF